MRAARLALALACAACWGGAALARHRGVRLPHPELLHPGDNPPLPEGFSLTQQVPAARAGQGPLNLPREIPARLSACWLPPGAQAGRRLEVSVKLSFRRDGSIIGTPFLTFVNAPAGSAARDNIGVTILDALKRCTPLPFTPSLGAAIAGRLFLIRFVSDPPKPKDTDI